MNAPCQAGVSSGGKRRYYEIEDRETGGQPNKAPKHNLLPERYHLQQTHFYYIILTSLMLPDITTLSLSQNTRSMRTSNVHQDGIVDMDPLCVKSYFQHKTFKSYFQHETFKSYFQHKTFNLVIFNFHGIIPGLPSWRPPGLSFVNLTSQIFKASSSTAAILPC